MSEDRLNRNPTGYGGLRYRAKDRWRAKFRRGEVESCCAIAKATGRRCRAPPVRGYRVCRNHGGWGGKGRHRLPVNMRHLGNQETKRARLYAEAEVEQLLASGELHPQTYESFRAMDRSRLHPADQGRLLLAISNRLHDNLTVEGWRETLSSVGLAPPRPPTPAPTPSAPEPKAELHSVEWWGSNRGKSPTGF